ncbi:MAG: homoserine kinase [Acidimicrobiia bacterium]
MSAIIRVPASSANLGPGFDALAMALGLYAEFGLVDDGIPHGAHRADEHHPAMVAFRLARGEGGLWVRSSIPMGRGMGYSGAVRVGGLVAAHVQHHGTADDDELTAARARWLLMATELEGHADNVAASIYGGVVATAAGRAVRIPMPFDPMVVVWAPSFTTSTDASRATLAATLPFAEAAFNVGRTALLVAALAAGDVAALRDATQDRMHQEVRFQAAAPSRVALDAALGAGAWCGWLSGSGPTIATLCRHDVVDDVARVLAAVPEPASTKVLRVDHAGAAIEAS